jgi:hypothetical protein
MPISFHHKCVLMTVGFLPVLWRPIATAWPAIIQYTATWAIGIGIYIPDHRCHSLADVQMHANTKQ